MIKAIWSLVTLAFAFMMSVSAFACLTQSPQMVAGMQHLGYPVYLLHILGTAKALGVLALLLPVPRALREWAYAGFTFLILGALWSHAATNDPPEVLQPAWVALGMSQVSYWLGRLRYCQKCGQSEEG